MRRAYDIDGVLVKKGSAPRFRLQQGDVIITGRSYENAERTYGDLRPLDSRFAVYFNPVASRDVTPQNAAEWKAHIIEKLKIEEFFEDDITQIEFIQALLPHVVFHHIV